MNSTIKSATWWTPDGFTLLPEPTVFTTLLDGGWEESLSQAGYSKITDCGDELDEFSYALYRNEANHHYFVEFRTVVDIFSQFFLQVCLSTTIQELPKVRLVLELLC